MKYTVKGNTIYTERNSVFFKYNVRKVLEIGLGKRIVVLLDVPDKTVINNLLCLDSDLNVVWRSEPLEKKYPDRIIYPFEEMVVIEDKLFAFDIVCRRYQIDPENGSVLDYQIMK